ncbi:hypothetical protein GMMP13_770088 [Candidatus Magnetomoraceae bacterium gMMP-13]
MDFGRCRNPLLTGAAFRLFVVLVVMIFRRNPLLTGAAFRLSVVLIYVCLGMS